MNRNDKHQEAIVPPIKPSIIKLRANISADYAVHRRNMTIGVPKSESHQSMKNLSTERLTA
jgi:hypothetical protein